ncbi:MAG: alpha/beta fold hydrolase [Bacteroidota bacterium]
MIKNLRAFTFIFCFLTGTISTKGQELVSSQFLGQRPLVLINFFDFPTPAIYPVDFYKITYTTTDTDGSQTVASGAVTIPVSNEVNSFPLTAYCHGTVLRRYDVPSAENFESNILVALSSAGYIGIAPDYLGLGDDEGVHPYVHAESQATATLDMIAATREFLDTVEEEDNGQVFITGYSQGGHAAMATLKYAQDNSLTDEIGLVAGAPLSGPYNMSGSQADLILSDDPYSTPGYVIYLLVSYQSVYGNLYNELSDVIQEPYATDVAQYFDGEQDEDEMGVVNDLLPNNISDFMQDSVLTNFENNPSHPLRVALEANDVFDWAPEFPLRMYYCDGDEQVAFENSTSTTQIMIDNGAPDVDSENVAPGANHGGCVLPALEAAYNFFETFANSLSTEDQNTNELNVWPNPANSILQVEFTKEIELVSLFDLNGRLVKEEIINARRFIWDTNDLPIGNYILVLNQTDQALRKLISIQR